LTDLRKQRPRWLLPALIAGPLLVAASLIVSRAKLFSDIAFEPAANLGELLERNGRLIVFRARDAGGTNDKRVAVRAIAERDGAPGFYRSRCERVAASALYVLCLSRTNDPLQPYRMTVFDRNMHEIGGDALDGVPSRARISPDEKYLATTSFVVGDSYASEVFSTRTFIRRIDKGTLGPADNVEYYDLILNNELYGFPDKNVWGITFVAGQDRFFATVSMNGHRYLVDGSIPAKRMVALRDNVECPSLSPDGLRIAYKQRIRDGQTVTWRFHVLDLVSGADRELGEERSVDDQIAWLDDQHVMYGVPRADTRDHSDIWSAPVDGGPPSLLMRDGDSPTVVERDAE
jgi:hypothetical protein